MNKTPQPKVKIINGDAHVSSMFRRAGWQMAAMNEDPDLICFCGGDDVSPSYYGEEAHGMTGPIDPDRDRQEKKVFDEYLKYPKVGICRGGQFLNVMSGGKLWQHVNRHGLFGDHDMVNLVDGTIIPVTSTHHQMMVEGPGAEVIGISREATKFEAGPGVVREKPKHDNEVIWYAGSNSFCVQGHPEYPNASEEFVNFFFGFIGHFWGLAGVEE